MEPILYKWESTIISKEILILRQNHQDFCIKPKAWRPLAESKDTKIIYDIYGPKKMEKYKCLRLDFDEIEFWVINGLKSLPPPITRNGRSWWYRADEIVECGSHDHTRKPHSICGGVYVLSSAKFGAWLKSCGCLSAEEM